MTEQKQIKEYIEFKNWSELYKWASEGKIIECEKIIFNPDVNGDYGLNFDLKLHYYKGVIFKEKRKTFAYKSKFTGQIQEFEHEIQLDRDWQRFPEADRELN